MPGLIEEIIALLEVPTANQWFGAAGFCIVFVAIGWAFYSAALRVDAADRKRLETEAAEKKAAAEKEAAEKAANMTESEILAERSKKARRYRDRNGIVFTDLNLTYAGETPDSFYDFLDPEMSDLATLYNWAVDHQKVIAQYDYHPTRKNGAWGRNWLPSRWKPVIDLTGNHITVQRDGAYTVDVPPQYRDIDLTEYGYTYWYDGNNDYAHVDDNGHIVPGCPKVIVPIHYSRFWKDQNDNHWENSDSCVGWNEFIEPKDISFDDPEDREVYDAYFYAPYGSVPAAFAFKLKADLEMQDSTKPFDQMLYDRGLADKGDTPEEERRFNSLTRRLEWDKDIANRMPGKVRKQPPSGSKERAGDDPLHGDWLGC